METSYDLLFKLLTSAASKLDAAASLVSDLKLAPDVNIGKIGESLVNIYQIQHEFTPYVRTSGPTFWISNVRRGSGPAFVHCGTLSRIRNPEKKSSARPTAQ